MNPGGDSVADATVRSGRGSSGTQQPDVHTLGRHDEVSIYGDIDGAPY